VTDVQLLTITLTLLAILGSVWANRKSVEDMRDVLRAELKAQAAEFNTAFQRIENKIPSPRTAAGWTNWKGSSDCRWSYWIASRWGTTGGRRYSSFCRERYRHRHSD
jgi:hypothetical protein